MDPNKNNVMHTVKNTAVIKLNSPRSQSSILNHSNEDCSWPQLPGSSQGNFKSPNENHMRTFSHIVKQQEAAPISRGKNIQDKSVDQQNEVIREGERSVEDQEHKKGSEQRVNRRERKKTEKEEKRRVREEEARKNLIAPKGQRVQVVNKRMLETLLNNSVTFVNRKCVVPVLSDKDFPTVEEAKKQRVKCTEASVEVQSSSSPTSRIRKRKDRIEVNLFNLIKRKPERVRAQKKSAVTSCYSGNQLDASNPERKRGKTKEVIKKKKPTPLKGAILEERALRQRLRTLSNMMEQINLGSEPPANYSRKFREYCDNNVTPRLNLAVKLLLKDLVRFQDRQHERNPVKAFARRRYVSGFREVKKHLQLKKVKMVLIAPDLEMSKNAGGIDETVAALKSTAAEQEVTLLFALSRREFGYLTYKKVGISCIGILSYEGSEANHEEVLAALTEARTSYRQATCEEEKEQAAADVNSQVIASLLSTLSVSESPFLSAIENVS